MKRKTFLTHKKRLTTSLLLSMLVLIIPNQVYASEDINKQMAQEIENNKTTHKSTKKLHTSYKHPYTYTYDTEGRLLSVYMHYGSFSTLNYYTYNPNGTYHYSGAGLIYHKDHYSNCVYVYDENQKLHYILSEKQITFYNTNGLLTDIVTLDTNGNETSRVTYIYNAYGDLLKCIRIGTEIFLEKDNHYTYDQYGNMLSSKEILFEDNSTKKCTITHYDLNGNILSEQHFQDDIETSRILYTYNSSGYLTEKTEMANLDSPTMSTIEYTAFTYDSKNHLLSEVYINHAKDVDTKIYTFDDFENELSYSHYTNGILDKYHVSTYDNNNNILSSKSYEKTYNNDILYGYSTYYYNNNDLLLKEITTYSSGYEYIIEYKYDIDNDLLARSPSETYTYYME